MFVDLIEESINDEKIAKRYLQKINSASERMTELISSLLVYSRISKNALKKEETDFNKVLINVVGDFELLIQQKKAIVNFENLPVIKAIPLQINQLFTNLLSNALKYNDKVPVITIMLQLYKVKIILTVQNIFRRALIAK